jgi:sugar phosphate permease
VERARYRWVILAAGVVAQGSLAAVFFGLPVLTPALRATYGLGLAEIGAVLASISVGALLTTLPWGLLADRAGERAVSASGLGIAAAALALAAASAGFAGLTAALFAAGVFGASILAASGRAVLRWFPPAQRGLALGIRQTSIPVGGALAALGLPLLVGAGGVRAALLALAACLAFSALACGVLLRSAPPVDHADDGMREVFRNRRLWRLSWGSSLLLAAQACLLGFVVLFLHDQRGLSTAAAAAVFAAMQLLGAILRLAAGHWSDHVADRIGPLLKLGAALGISLAVAASLLRAPLELLLPVLVATGALSMSWNGLSFTAAAELGGPARAGAALGLHQTLLGAAAALTPITFALLVEASTWTVGFAVAAAAALLGTVVVRGSAATWADAPLATGRQA